MRDCKKRIVKKDSGVQCTGGDDVTRSVEDCDSGRTFGLRPAALELKLIVAAG